MKRALVAVGCAVLLLAGCAPDTREAQSSCYDYLVEHWQADNPDASNAELVDWLTTAQQTCERDAEQDPAKFLELWG